MSMEVMADIYKQRYIPHWKYLPRPPPNQGPLFKKNLTKDRMRNLMESEYVYDLTKL